MSSTADTTSVGGGDTTAAAKAEDDQANGITQSFPPSHILQDGRFIWLPPPNEQERSRFFERSIAKYGLLESDMADAKEGDTKEDDDASTTKDDTAPKVHPLAIASARLQAAGINELNRAINLSTLVNTGEYFGLTNIVDPTLELNVAAAVKAEQAAKEAAGGENKEGQGAAAAPPPPPTIAPAANQKELQEEQRIKSAYILKRKRAVFDKASRILQRHQQRLESSIAAQAVPDERLRQLRRQWRLVAPEHGTRAKPHATRPTEVVAIDVDVYDPTGGGSVGSSLAGRLASQVPRYATVELTEEYNNHKAKAEKGDEENAMDVDSSPVKKKSKKSDKDSKEKESEQQQLSQFTMAEPFAIADPTLGKISTDFDPNKVTFLTLQFDIEKPSTGFCMSSCLKPMTTTTIEKLQEDEEKETTTKKEDENGDKKPAAKEKKKDHQLPDDEQVLVSLQHSLFCAKLFEAIRMEIMGEDSSEDETAQQAQQKAAQRQQQQQQQSQQSVMWLSSESEENFLPPPSVMVPGAPALCVVHCHASEVKVQLDCEYTLKAKLVEAEEDAQHHHLAQYGEDHANNTKNSGSQTPEQLHVLCRSLLLHAQEAYHDHSLKEAMALMKRKQEEEERLLEIHKPRGLDRIQKKDVRKLPKILQSVVGLGTKMLFEQRIRKVLVRVRRWLQTAYPKCRDALITQWLHSSLFHPVSKFVMSFGTSVTIDVELQRDELLVHTVELVTTEGSSSGGANRTVKFHSDYEFEIFMKVELRRQMKQRQQQQMPTNGLTTNGTPAITVQ